MVSKTNLIHRHKLLKNVLIKHANTLIRQVYRKQKPLILRYVRSRSPKMAIEGLPLFFKVNFKPMWQRALKQVWQNAAEEAEGFVKEHHLTVKKAEEKIEKDWQDYADEWMDQHAGTKIDGIVDTDRDWLANTLRSGVSEGKTQDEIADDLVDDFDNMSEGRAGTIARTETAGAFNYASNETASDLMPDGSTKTWNTTSDKPRPWHEDADGQTVPIDEPFNVMDEDLMYPGDPDGSAENVVNCFTEATEVLTENGFISIKDVTKEDVLATLNSEDFRIEYMSPRRLIKQRFSGDLVRIKNVTTNITTTKNHRFPILDRWFYEKEKRLVVQFKEADQLHYGDMLLRRHGSWVGNNWEELEINGVRYNARDFMRFMGWYLSEGSTAKRSEKHYQITIAQKHDTQRKEIKELCAKLFTCKINEQGVGRGWPVIQFSNTEIGAYLHRLGKSYEKFIPFGLKQLSCELLEDLLGTFNKGDGSVQQDKPNWHKRRLFFTSSKRLADDIGELIIKTGNYPSFRFPTISDLQTISFRNGNYTIKHPAIWIFENIRNAGTFLPRYKSYVKHDGFVYCVEMPRNHIIYVRQEGKCMWCGNCLCVVSYDLGANAPSEESELSPEEEESALSEASMALPEEEK